MSRQTTFRALGVLCVGAVVVSVPAAPAWAEGGPPDGIGAITDEAIEFEIEREVHYGEQPTPPPSGNPGQDGGDSGQGSGGGAGGGSGGGTGGGGDQQAGSGGSGGGAGGIADQIYAQPPSVHNCHEDGEVTSSDCLEVIRTTCGAAEIAMAGACQETVEQEAPAAPDEPAAEPQPGEPAEEDEPQPLPVVTEADFAELPIEASTVGFEPDFQGFGFLDSHTNVFAESETQVLTEAMLGYQVDIRAIPIEFHFDYGDGTTVTSFDPGSALPDYDSAGYAVDKTDTATATSHVYTASGTFEVTIGTTFIGEYRVDGGEWIGIPGEAVISSSPGNADIWQMSSRSVGGECETQDAWGCNGPVELEPGDEPPAIFEDQYDENGNWIG